jgi:hypothetical protein
VSPTASHPHIHTFFPVAWAHTPQEVAGAQLMEEEIALLVHEESARDAHMEARKEKYAKASLLKGIPKEKGVHWSKASDRKIEDANQSPSDSIPLSALLLLPREGPSTGRQHSWIG